MHANAIRPAGARYGRHGAERSPTGLPGISGPHPNLSRTNPFRSPGSGPQRGRLRPGPPFRLLFFFAKNAVFWVLERRGGCPCAPPLPTQPGDTGIRRFLDIALLLCLTAAAPDLGAEEPEPYFYRGHTYGSEAVINPLTTVINGGFGILQISNRSNDLSTVDFGAGLRNVTWNLSHPFRTIDQYGWGNFLSREVIPGSVKIKSSQFYPNYYNHLIGGGFTWRAFGDWFRFHGYPYPRLWATTFWMGYHLLNEVVENNAYDGPNVDPIADIYLFNTAGLLLFSSDRVARFFAHTLNLRDWSFMPAYDPWRNSIENNGQNFMARVRIPGADRLSLMYHWGVHGMYGLSYHRADGNTLSLSGGLVVKDLVETDNDTGVRELTATLVWTGGGFWDRDGSLLASLILSGTKGYRGRLNVYPGVVRLGRFSPALSATLLKNNAVVLGLTTGGLPFGLARRVR